ncbi:MAG: hypothetical protein ABSG84_14630 [Acidobacteriaceae bacterium]|jgi:hypothetical protein
MISKLRITLLLPLAALLACGSTPSGTSTQTNAYNFSGDWGVRTEANPDTIQITGFSGALSATAGVVSGELTTYTNPFTPCMTPSITPVPVSGTVSADGNLTLSLPVAGGTATLSATLTTNLNTFASGTYQVVGGTCAMAATAMQIAQYAPLSGTYTGTFSVLNSYDLPTPGTATTITAVLSQSATNTGAEFPVTGTVTTTGACVVSFTLSNTYVWGGVMMAGDSTFSYSLIAGFDPTGSVTDIGIFTDSVTGSNCPNAGQYFDGVLTRQ